MAVEWNRSLNVFGRKRGKTESSVTGVCLVGFTPKGRASGSRKGSQEGGGSLHVAEHNTRLSPSGQGRALKGTDFTSDLSPNSAALCTNSKLHLADVFFLRLSVILLLCLTVHTSDSCNNSGCSPLVPVTWWRLSLYDALHQGGVGQHA